MTIYFDMDGTIADLYGVDNWLADLRAEKVSPYLEAEPLTNMIELQDYLLGLQELGYDLGIISWTSKSGSAEYNEAVRIAKVLWLRQMLPLVRFNEMHIVKYGTRKDYVAKDKNGIIFDDDERVREKWRGKAVNPNTEDIIETLKRIANLSE